jgi:peptide/nickel transport system substrate-binding protein
VIRARVEEALVDGRFKAAIVSAVSVAALAVAATTGLGAARKLGAQAPVRGGDLVVARVGPTVSLDKTTEFDNESAWVFQQIYQPLFASSKDGRAVVPRLATGYSVSNGGRTYTIHLRSGVRFSNGQSMTARDVKFSLDDARTVKGGWSFIDAAISSVAAPNPSTVVVHTKTRWAPLLADLAMFNNGIIPANFDGKSRAAFYANPIGTGPFELSSWNKGGNIKLVRNPFYWEKGKPYLDSITWTPVSDDNTRILQLRGGQAQIDEFPPFGAISGLTHASGVSVGLFPAARVDFMVMNEKQAPFQDVHVRRAISYAIDRKAIVAAVLRGYGKVANSLLPSALRYYNAQTPGLQFNLAKAKAEMAKSSVPNGFKTTILIGTQTATTDSAIAEIFQQELKPLGISVSIKLEDHAVAQDAVAGFHYQLAHEGFTMDIVDPDELIQFGVVPNGGTDSMFTNYADPKVTRWAAEAEQTTSSARRAQLYKLIQTETAANPPAVYLYYPLQAYAFSTKVHGFFVYPTGSYRAEDIWLSK